MKLNQIIPDKNCSSEVDKIKDRQLHFKQDVADLH